MQVPVHAGGGGAQDTRARRVWKGFVGAEVELRPLNGHHEAFPSGLELRREYHLTQCEG